MDKYNIAEFFKKLITYRDRDEFMQKIDSHL